MFISPAYAQAGAGSAFDPGFLIMIVLMFGVFYFLLIRPQQKKARIHREMLAAIRRGDRIVTGGGLIGTVTKVIDENELLVEIADGIRVRVQRSMVAGVRAKTEPIRESSAPSGPGPGQQQEGPAAKLKGLLGGKK